MGRMMASTIYELRGVRTDEDTRRIKNKVYDVPAVGGIAFEFHPGDAVRMICKHVAVRQLDDEEIAGAVRAAGHRYGIRGRVSHDASESV